MSILRTKSTSKSITRVYHLNTEVALSELESSILDASILPDAFSKAHLKYDKNERRPIGFTEYLIERPECYPLKFSSEDGTQEVWLAGVTAGYHGKGPEGTLKALQMMGFNITEAEKDALFSTTKSDFVYKK